MSQTMCFEHDLKIIIALDFIQFFWELRRLWRFTIKDFPFTKKDSSKPKEETLKATGFRLG